MAGLRELLMTAPMSQQDRDDVRSQMMDAASSKYKTTSQREGATYQAAGNALASKIHEPGLRRSLLNAMSAFDTANMRGLTRSQRQQMMGAIDMTLPRPVSPTQIQTPYNQTLFGPPQGYDLRYLGQNRRSVRPSWMNYDYDEED